ncbi:sensor histidine kinase [Algoriphagus zhangzhouensis]|uniref:Histidine kinase n=1 Tax=Algoriphagus zhangzhouensis TaxID=1073327 RepID=A0A1M7Z535_9BACT|nr:sensor histidine kinase [Algoriphagus zhangzhouensis]TDY48854.1 histidine kinase [Algoriphagus zhangzhouensis]SHO60057.1 Histidine kinase [Algoriphagus zhangzhouensis]
MKFIRSWWLHFFGGVAFLLVPVILSPQPPEVSRFALDPATIQELFSNALMLGFFYLNYFLLIPKFFQKGHYLIYFLWVGISFLLIIGIPEVVFSNEPGGNIPALNHNPPPKPNSEFRPDRGPGHQPPGFGAGPNSFLDKLFPWEELASYAYQLLLFSVVVMFSILLRLREALFQTEQAKSKAEIGSLKNQINPHFLFNTLNSIYALSIREKADKTGESVMKLSKMMRYVVSDSMEDRVSLESEIQYIENYLELQKLRLPIDFSLDYKKKGSFAGKKIAPLILISFVENAFKHGVSPEETGEVKIILETQGDEFILMVQNKIVSHQLAQHEKSGFGLGNTLSRLKLIYGDKQELEIGERNSYFRVHLRINLEC